MKTQNSALSIGLLSVLAFCQTTHAVVYPNPLATSTRMINNVAVNSFTVRLGQNLGLGIGNVIFDNLTFNLASVGQTYYVTQAQDSDFNALVAVLRNGQSDFIAFEYSAPNLVGIAQAENAFFSPLPAGNNGIDFQGFPIDNISLHFDSATLGGSGYNYQVTFAINSAPIPEPATGALAMLGGTICTFMARRKKTLSK